MGRELGFSRKEPRNCLASCEVKYIVNRVHQLSSNSAYIFTVIFDSAIYFSYSETLDPNYSSDGKVTGLLCCNVFGKRFHSYG